MTVSLGYHYIRQSHVRLPPSQPSNVRHGRRASPVRGAFHAFVVTTGERWTGTGGARSETSVD